MQAGGAAAATFEGASQRQSDPPETVPSATPSISPMLTTDAPSTFTRSTGVRL